jgi:hypothetical protein
MTKPVVSFVIPVRNDAARLQRCLRSIDGNAPAGIASEILVIDNGSTDASVDVARTAGARVIEQRQGSVAQLRNAGAAHAAGSILAFVDADNEIGPAWLPAGCSLLANPDVAAAGALYEPPGDGTWVQRSYGLLRGTTRGECDVEWLGSGNMMVRRGAFEAVGGFDTSLTTCEDVDLCNRLRSRGHRIVSSIHMNSVHHGDPATLRDVFVGELWRGRDNLRVSIRQLSWRSVPSILIPVVDLVLIAIGVAGIAALAARISGGFTLLAVSVFLVAAAATLRVLRALASDVRIGPAGVLQAWLVSIVHDIARALALIVRVRHRRSHSLPQDV